MSLKSSQQLLKAIIAFPVAFFCLIVGIDNIIDFQTNYVFVEGVLGMGKMEPFFSADPDMTGRAIHDPTIQTYAYYLIIAGEIITGVVCLSGFLLMISSINKSRFAKGQIIYLYGCMCAIFIWYFGFAVIGGEYFSMWANTMNGQMKAYTFSIFILLSAIFVAMPYIKSGE